MHFIGNRPAFFILYLIEVDIERKTIPIEIFSRKNVDTNIGRGNKEKGIKLFPFLKMAEKYGGWPVHI